MMQSVVRPMLFGVLGAVAIIAFAYGILAMTVPARGASCEQVTVSYYGKETCRLGRKCQTADGTPFDGTQMLVAHRSLPFGTKVRFTRNGKSVTLIVRDRGPFVAGRSYDLSESAARKLGFIRAGVTKLCAEVL